MDEIVLFNYKILLLMKKILLSVFFSLTVLTMNAQDDNGIYVKAGIGASTVVGSDADAASSTFSYKVGVAYDWEVANNFYIIPEVDFVAKGFNSENIVGNINMSYIQIPIFAAYKYGITDNIKIGAQVGPYFSCGIFGSDIEVYSGTDFNIFDSDLGYRRFDAGIIAGISVELYNFLIGFEYSRGFVTLDPDYSQFNQALGVTFGYKF